MSTDIIPVHLISAFTAESQALESAGGTMAACGRGIMSTDIIPAPIRVCPKGQTNSLANRVHPAEHSMSETWYNVDRHDTCATSGA